MDMSIYSEAQRQRDIARLSELHARSSGGALTSEEESEAKGLRDTLHAWFGDHQGELDSIPDDDELGDPVQI